MSASLDLQKYSGEAPEGWYFKTLPFRAWTVLLSRHFTFFSFIFAMHFIKEQAFKGVLEGLDLCTCV